jgi:uncharacterized 2Fe-2S/4Fe-4S cluster protein (DUF4445 family)
MLVRRWGAELNDIHEVFLAGAFGNYMNLTSAQRIGLIELPPDRVCPVGNSSLLGAKLALFNPDLESTVYESVLSRTQHFSLSADPEFQDIYMDCMQFPVAAQEAS